ncbi:hypothetical protein J7E99_38965 [Streptomyces sp. ISL-44]|uniref:hypothetical protein n=1 Tax=Streptomyces sp. ISL-44 TaxID=2819184 RepID=UPI001BE97811|nr:hypothetical protein [Streptomyces sp. ISL-44]MBT2546481.1 hypothetical protein [Streptomyces sp. ISL-44]
MRSRPTAAAALQPPDLRDWLPEDYLAWFVIEAIEQLHLEPKTMLTPLATPTASSGEARSGSSAAAARTSPSG